MAIKHETIEVSGTVLYCDGCGTRGPESAYDNISDTIDMAQQDGWQAGGDDDRDLCPACKDKEKAKSKSTRKRTR
jgi:hypothetical protein